MANRIDCIVKDDRLNPWERILSVGGVNSDGTRWKISQSEAIKRIENRTNHFVVGSGARQVDVVVRKSQFGNKYIKTAADGENDNNLLSLSTCPI